MKRKYIADGLSTYEAARFLGISRTTVQRYARAGRVGTRIDTGKRVIYRYTAEELERFRAALDAREGQT